jgi:NAD(P)-dependent dehydrogenase (short-subunit alcohol dehydrogenase family)
MVEIFLDGQTAVVTGSTSGIGRAIALELADHGANVVVNGRSRDRGEDAVAEIEDRGADALFVPADINQYDEVETMMDTAVEEFGSIEVLVPNGAAAAGPVPDFFENTVPAAILELCEVAYANRLYAIKAALDPLKESSGRVVSITADAGQVPTPAEATIGGANAALMMATRVLASELARWEITVNAVSISVTEDTPARDWVMDDSPAAHVFQKAIERQTFPVTAEHVAETVAFIAGSEGAGPMTGQILSINGGISFPG